MKHEAYQCKLVHMRGCFMSPLLAVAIPGTHGFGDLAVLQAPVDWILHMFWTLLTRLSIADPISATP